MNDSILSQEDIDALFNQTNSKPAISIEDFLSPIEQDALGEIGNIALGSSTTALSTLLNQRVEITTPKMMVIEHEKMEELIDEPHVAVHVDYTTGIRGKNLLMIREYDARVIANLMMGGDGTMLDPELSEFHLSAVQEAMNQMMGSAATSMSTMFHQKVDISPPSIDVLGFPPKRLEDFEEEIIIEISFTLKIGSLIDSNMIQFIPLTFGKEMIHKLMESSNEQMVAQEQPISPPQPSPVQPSVTRSLGDTETMNNRKAVSSQTMPPLQTNVQKVEFSSFSERNDSSSGSANLDLLFDIPLNITVELGRTEMQIRKILELGPGAVIELDKLAGEPVDILANNKLIAKGEVVVIEENFGVRITDIISPTDRLTRMTK